MLRPRTPTHLRIGGGLLVCALALVAAEPVATACGGFFNRKLAPEQQPSLAREKVLIVHDAGRGRQHFIREVAFRRADQRFGFVVPTPTRPEVAKVDTNPFTLLRSIFPFGGMLIGSGGGGTGSGYGAGFGGRGGVEVLAVEKVGSFTAFTLAATDAAALTGWLEDNDLASTPESDRWLAHYVRMGFYYVAMRYDPPPEARKDKDAPVAAETIRISFATPIAYYPYFEPEPEHDPKTPRLLELWYVGNAPVVPVALHRDPDGGAAQWVRPLKAGEQHPEARPQLEIALQQEIEDLLPAGRLVVQTFQDQKRRRTGFQDILFAAADARPLSPEQQAALGPLLGVLDPGLTEGAR